MRCRCSSLIITREYPPCGPPGIRPLTADGSRRAAPLYFTPRVFFFFSLPPPPPPPPPHRSLLHGAKRARKILREKNATASAPIPASTAQCTRQKHPLNIGVYGPRRGKSARVKPPWSFGHLSAFAVLFLSVLLSISLFSLRRFFAFSFSIGGERAYPPSSKPTFPLFFPLLHHRLSLLFHSHPLRADFPASSPAHAGARSASRWKQPGDKRHRRQKCCPPPAENGAVILMQVPVGPAILPLPSSLPATPVEVRGIRASSRRRYHDSF